MCTSKPGNANTRTAPQQWMNKTGGHHITQAVQGNTGENKILFRRLNWQNKGVKIDGDFVNNITLLVAHSYAQEHHDHYNRCYNNYVMKVGKLVQVLTR